MRAVKLLRSYRSNNAGEVCGFPDAEAASLVAAGAAMWLTPVMPPSTAPAGPTATGSGGPGGDTLSGGGVDGDDSLSGGSGGDDTLTGGDDGAAPAGPSATGRTIRHAGRGMYDVFAADGAKLTEKALPRAEAEAMAAQG